MPAKPPEHEHHPSSFPPATSFSSSSILIHQSPTIGFSPPLIAMVVVAAAAFLFITYSRLISRHIFPPFLRLYRHHRRRFLPSSDLASPPAPYQWQSSDGFYVYSPCPYGLDDSVIQNIPLTKLKFIELLDEDGFHFHDCAVCLVDFQEGECIRTLPHCCHPFHVDCIDMWLRSHATCPLCRAGVFFSPPPDDSHSHPHPHRHVQLSPVMAARVRPSFDQGILLESMFLEHLQEGNNSDEIQEIFSPESERRAIQSERSSNNRRELDSLLKRSYSFGFERRGSYPSVSEERLVMEPATTPYHHHRQRRSFFWTKRPSSSSTPFRSMAKSRVFSSRRTMKSQSPGYYFRRKGYISMWESSESLRYGSSRRMKASPGPFSSSRMRLGDPEALISPERYKTIDGRR